MKKVALPIVLLICGLLAFSCTNYTWVIPRCEWVNADAVQPLPVSVYQPTQSDTCIAYLPPFDHAGWFESNLNSRRLRGQTNVRIGCSHCPAGNQDCDSNNNCGGCTTATFSFDFATVQEDAEIVSAKLAVYVLADQGSILQTILKARKNVGGDYAVVAGAPVIVDNWALYDITPFACEAVAERRNAADLELSLPCRAGARPWLATVALSGKKDISEPRIVFEFR